MRDAEPGDVEGDVSFTKGPWSVENPIQNQLWIVEANRQPRDWKDVAIVCVGEFGHPEETAWANARLIAAAPDLLAALEKIVDQLAGEQWSEEAIDVAFNLTGLGALVNRGRAAIKKARGDAE